MQKKDSGQRGSYRYQIQGNSIQSNPHKRYKRLRRKWLILFLVIGSVIIQRGALYKWQEWNDARKQTEGQNQNGNDVYEGEKDDSEETEVPRDDYQYLEGSPDIRVVLQAGQYAGIYHARVDVTFPEGGYVLVGKNNQWIRNTVSPGKSVSVGIGQEFDFSIDQETMIALVPADENAEFQVTSIQRNRTVCSYFGRLEVTLEDAGLLAVNVLPLEKYLCSVVPSEMPASYGEEALKAQAVLARTYAYKYLIEPAYPEFGAHVDDSISFQVYGNIDSSASTSKAVADTAGVLLFSDRSLAEVYYYSTSCGFGTDGTAWGGVGQPYLQGLRIGPGVLGMADGSLKGEEAEQYYLELLKEEQIFRNMISAPFAKGYEAEESWYRWQAEKVEVNSKEILDRLKERYQIKPDAVLIQNRKGEFVSGGVKELGDIEKITIDERGIGGICRSMIIQGSKNTYKVLLEYNIRYVLNGAGTTVIRSDGTEAYCKTLLPSGFFYIDTVQFGKNVISYSIYGGGYGHGVGMTQNGANQMALVGLSCSEILQKFFPGTIFVNYESSNSDH